MIKSKILLCKRFIQSKRLVAVAVQLFGNTKFLRAKTYNLFFEITFLQQPYSNPNQNSRRSFLKQQQKSRLLLKSGTIQHTFS